MGSQTSTLMTIPSEIRNQIYELCLADLSLHVSTTPRRKTDAERRAVPLSGPHRAVEVSRPNIRTMHISYDTQIPLALVLVCRQTATELRSFLPKATTLILNTVPVSEPTFLRALHASLHNAESPLQLPLSVLHTITTLVLQRELTTDGRFQNVSAWKDVRFVSKDFLSQLDGLRRLVRDHGNIKKLIMSWPLEEGGRRDVEFSRRDCFGRESGDERIWSRRCACKEWGER